MYAFIKKLLSIILSALALSIMLSCMGTPQGKEQSPPSPPEGNEENPPTPPAGNEENPPVLPEGNETPPTTPKPSRKLPSVPQPKEEFLQPPCNRKVEKAG